VNNIQKVKERLKHAIAFFESKYSEELFEAEKFIFKGTIAAYKHCLEIVNEAFDEKH